MGFLSKAWKGIKKGVKSIGKGIKSAFNKFGKFMGKIGVLGQVAMMFVMPYIGAALGSAFTGAAGALATNTVGGALGAVGQAAGKMMQYVGSAVGKVGNVFNNVTKGVTDTLTNFAKTATNKLANTVGMDNVFQDAAANFFGSGGTDSAFGRSFGETSRFQRLGTSQDVFAGEQKERLKAIADTNFEAIEFPTADTKLAETRSNVFDNVNLDTDSVVNPSQEALGTTQTFGEGTISGKYDTKFSDLKTDSFLRKTQAQARANFDAITFPVADTQLATTQTPSFFDSIKAMPKNMYDTAAANVTAFVEDPLGKTFEGFEQNVQGSVQNSLLQAGGLQAKPEYNVQNVSNVAYVPGFDSFGGSQQQYGAQEIMGARSFEQNVLNSPTPYGYTAFQYGQYMNQGTA
tara:strand:- start:3204 stop:4412 length:1209 start_codon:yes stop_codon:yes gene_type:complete